MIKFFRKIRQQLIQENKMGKYFKYAIGEILLVVIGILIALQINNWNENRKEAENQSKLFANLKIDFQNRLSELEEFQIAKQKTVENALKLNAIIANLPNAIDEPAVAEMLVNLQNNFFFNEDFKLLEGVFNTGLINNIKDETLKRKLIEWPQLVEEMLEEQRIFYTDNNTKYGPLLNKYISRRKLYENFKFREYALPKGPPTTLKEDYKGLLTDPLLENYIATKELLLRVSLIDIKNLIDAAKEIIKLLEENQ